MYAYQLAVAYNINHPQTWDEKRIAGFTDSLSMRSAEALSLARATSFKRANVL